jgi:hypothetical protein
MSQLGQSRSNWAARVMSGLPPLATELRTSPEARLVPLGDMRAWRELKEATHEVVFMPTRQISATWR